MTTGTEPISAKPDGKKAREWARIASTYSEPKVGRSVLQVLNTSVPLIAIWLVMAQSVDKAYWLTLALTPLAAAFLMRLFLIQHDCGHYAFFRSRRWNDWLGHVIGVFTLTPHGYWRRAHNIHHAGSGNLGKRGIGDMDLLTVREYLALSWLGRLRYRLYRHPLVMLGIGPAYVFFLKNRLPVDLLLRHRDALPSVLGTNIALLGLFVGLGWIFGFVNILLVTVPIVFFSAMVGIWLFYIQHQFENTYWRENEDWDFHEAAVVGSSLYMLPQPLRWFSADIGLHHLHHLSCRIPNYRLAECLRDNPEMNNVTRIGFLEGFTCLRLALWDEADNRLIGFGDLRKPAV